MEVSGLSWCYRLPLTWLPSLSSPSPWLNCNTPRALCFSVYLNGHLLPISCSVLASASLSLHHAQLLPMLLLPHLGWPQKHRSHGAPLTHVKPSQISQPMSVRWSVSPLPGARRVYGVVHGDINPRIKNSECRCGSSQGNSKNTLERSSLQRVILLWRQT